MPQLIHQACMVSNYSSFFWPSYRFLLQFENYYAVGLRLHLEKIRLSFVLCTGLSKTHSEDLSSLFSVPSVLVI